MKPKKTVEELQKALESATATVQALTDLNQMLKDKINNLLALQPEPQTLEFYK